MTNTVPNHVGLGSPFAAPVPARESRTRTSPQREERVVRTRFAELVPMIPVVLAVLSFGASIDATSEVHRQLFLALSIVFVAVGLGAVGAATHEPGVDGAMTQEPAMQDNRSNVVPNFQTTTQRSAEFELIDDTFSGSDLKGMLMPLLDAEINHYKLACLSSQVKSECTDEDAQSRSARIASTRSEIEAMLQQAAKSGKRVRVHSTVHISIDAVDLGGARSSA